VGVECGGDPWCTDASPTISLNLNSNSVNNLGGFRSQSDPAYIRWPKVAAFEGQDLDLIVEEVGGTGYADSRDYSWGGKTAATWANDRNGDPYPGSGVGAIAVLKQGTYSFKFTLVAHDPSGASRDEVTVNYFSMTYFDLDGDKEQLSTKSAVGMLAKTPDNSPPAQDEKIFEHSLSNSPYIKKWGCQDDGAGLKCMANAANAEISHPETNDEWDHLRGDSRKAAVTFHFKDTSSFTMDYITTYPHRWFLFKGSKSLCDAEVEEKPRPRPRPPPAPSTRRRRIIF